MRKAGLLLATVLFGCAPSGQGQNYDATAAAQKVEQLGSAYQSASAQARQELLAAGERGLPVLRLAIDQGNYRARAQALLAIAEIERQRLASGLEPRYLDDLIAGLGDEAEGVRRAALRGLVYLGDVARDTIRARLIGRGGAALSALQEIEGTIMQRHVEEALASVISADGSYGTYPGAFAHVGALGQAAAAICLRIFGDGNFEALSPRLRGNLIEAEKVRYLAGSALFEIAGEEIAPVLRRMIDAAIANPGDPDMPNGYAANLSTILALQGDVSRYYVQLGQLEDQATSMQRFAGGSYLASSIADMYLKAGRNRSSVHWFQEASQDLRVPGRNVHVYNIACAYSRMHEKDRALAELVRAVNLGYTALAWMQKDGDLDYIRNEPEFKEIEAILSSQNADARDDDLDELYHRLRSRVD